MARFLVVLHILLAPACEGSLVFQRFLAAEGWFDKDECATTYPFAHSSHSRALKPRADPQDSEPHHSLREERMCNPQARTHQGPPSPYSRWRRSFIQTADHSIRRINSPNIYVSMVSALRWVGPVCAGTMPGPSPSTPH